MIPILFNDKSKIQIGISPKRVTSGRVYLRDLAPFLGNTASKKHHNGCESLATLCRFDWSGNWTSDLPHQQHALDDWANVNILQIHNFRELHVDFERAVSRIITPFTCPIYMGFEPTLMRACCCGLFTTQLNFWCHNLKKWSWHQAHSNKLTSIWA